MKPVGFQSTGEALVSYYINRIWFVCPSVCLFVSLSVRIKLENQNTYMDMLYMDRSGISREWFLSMFRGRPTDRPDATVRKPDTGRKKHSKIAFFSRFSMNLRVLKGLYGLDVLNHFKGCHVPPFRWLLENLVHFGLANYTKNRPKIGQNRLKVMFLNRAISQERLKRYKIWLHIWSAREFLLDACRLRFSISRLLHPSKWRQSWPIFKKCDFRWK